jgi:hypothetical protein
MNSIRRLSIAFLAVAAIAASSVSGAQAFNLLDPIGALDGLPVPRIDVQPPTVTIPGPGPIVQPFPGSVPVPMGSACQTPVGIFPGPANPIGMFCTANTPWGVQPGHVI